MYLSKSSLMTGLQCPKALWLSKNKKQLAKPPDAMQLNVFRTGRKVGELARQLWPGGVEIEYHADEQQAMIDATREAIAQAGVIYEGSFACNGVFVRADILLRDGDGWNLYEVKASSRVKSHHYDDVAIQWYAISRHLPLKQAWVVHVDSGYTRQGELDVQQLFSMQDITGQVKEKQADIESGLTGLETLLQGSEPDIGIGRQCHSPYECDFIGYCWQSVPHPSVFDLHKLSGKRKFEWFHRGIVRYQDIPASAALNAAQSLQVTTALNGEPYLDRPRLSEYLAGVEYPINFLDFESFQEAIPRFDGQKPYMKMPFQYSLHILQQDGQYEHKEFLANEFADPRADLARALIRDITPRGTIMAYHQSFEIGVISGLANHFDELRPGLMAMISRFNDLIIPFRRLIYYHPDFNGSFSIKDVLPALFPNDPELSYKSLVIRGGDVASDEFANLHLNHSAEQREQIRDALIAYCRLDTLAMVKIWGFLQKL